MKPDPKYRFRPYAQPKTGLFKVETDNGPALEQNVIIGETVNGYVTRIIETEEGEWVGNTVITRKRVLPVYIHRTRFREWLTGQTALF